MTNYEKAMKLLNRLERRERCPFTSFLDLISKPIYEEGLFTIDGKSFDSVRNRFTGTIKLKISNENLNKFWIKR